MGHAFSAELRWYYAASDAELGYCSNFRMDEPTLSERTGGPTKRQCDAARHQAVVRDALRRLEPVHRGALRIAYTPRRNALDTRHRFGELGAPIVDALLRHDPVASKTYPSSQIRSMVSELLEAAHRNYKASRAPVRSRAQRVASRVESFLREAELWPDPS